ncbi:MAG: hypothetical protein COV38_01415 [Bdellovibrionales bacterium CG11_big_fil_rev_8_21_14_0_20_38_13]|nr:MAG: hypothetical protein COW79_12860 [Bdellovibrionales bacterium CG22_combo_CG10-13_8_21_14_all_38_13]PIR31242.1 MAG: hypothetical protein COV38_01415 [Bdellovibrionales bacterium CG11_big_fil_rev_8_21_14_0_20_38_13]
MAQYLDIPYYQDYLSKEMLAHLLSKSKNVAPNLEMVGEPSGLENKDSLQFLCELYDLVKDDLAKVLHNRIEDRKFIDQRVKALYQYNKENGTSIDSAEYETILGLEDSNGRVVIGPLQESYAKTSKQNPVAPIPSYLQGHHITLFGPPDSAKMSVNAMNSYHRILADEPSVVAELLKDFKDAPKWGADNEDSKTPMHADLVSAGDNLTKCFNRNIDFIDERGKEYKLEKNNLALPIKRFPGLALPSFFLFYKKNPIPLHMYDFALHMFANWNNPEALVFYVPKLENEEEARYIHTMLEACEKLLVNRHPDYKMGTIRLMIVLENPRAILRVNEIMDELHPYFAGASLGWHDYLGSTARLFKEDGNYRIPVKADPNIVIKYIKASHDLLNTVVGPRGGIKVGGMYGILPVKNEMSGPSFQVTMKGYIKDVVTQLKRGLDGFWVAHPDFVRLGMALVAAWRQPTKDKLYELVKSLLDEKYHNEIISFIDGPDIEGLKVSDERYVRSLLVADIKESSYIANNHPDEIRYNVFQSLQYLADWLSGNGCVALPAKVEGELVRVMDDLATAERSRWEVWHEIYHGRFSLEEFLEIAHEELHFIRKDLSHEKKIVQVKWNEVNAKWYPVAFNLMIKLMSDKNPVEFAPELLLPFTTDEIRSSDDPWMKACELNPTKYQVDDSIDRFNYYFERCGCFDFAKTLSKNVFLNENEAKDLILKFTKDQIIEAASFHGNIGEAKKTLDAMAASEQSRVFGEEASVINELKEWGDKYLLKFGVKFLISAKGKSGKELLEALKLRFNNSEAEELDNARSALWEITKKRFDQKDELIELKNKYNIEDFQLSVSSAAFKHQLMSYGDITNSTYFEVASLSKSVASAFSIEYLASKGIGLEDKVNAVLSKTKSSFRLKGEWGDEVTISNLMSHNALNMHYVNGVPCDQDMPNVLELLAGHKEFGYPAVEVINKPSTVFKYSGGGFLVLEHLIEAISDESIVKLTTPFLKALGMSEFSFDQKENEAHDYAHAINELGQPFSSSRLMFPSFAAGAMGSASSMHQFLHHLTHAYHDVEGSGPISHDTAVMMLYGRDLGSREFMGCDMGIGIFTIEAGENRFMLHQGANDGFRSLFLHCFMGPDLGKGIVVFSNGELNAVGLISEITQLALKKLGVSGIDYSKFKSSFNNQGIKQEEVVNTGYKSLIFDAFNRDAALPIEHPGAKSSYSDQNLLIGSKVLKVTNDRFARAENLISALDPVFDPTLFERQGKVMDSWESARHNQAESEDLILELPKKCKPKIARICTKFHTGNHVPCVSLEGRVDGEWIEILAPTPLNGHSVKFVEVKQIEMKQLRVRTYPDGGLTRLALFEEPLEQQVSGKYQDSVPAPKKPLMLPIRKLKPSKNLSVGGKILKVGDEHYSPAISALSPYPPLHMFDGMENSRSRVKGHSEEVEIGLSKKANVRMIELDFTHFVNNNPMYISIDIGDKQVVSKSFVKPFAANTKRFIIEPIETDRLKITIHPDGGINRIRVYE